MLSFKPASSLSSFTLIKKLFSSSSLSAFRVVSSVYLRLLIFLSAILIPSCDSSSLAFCVMCSAYKLNKQGDSIQLYIHRIIETKRIPDHLTHLLRNLYAGQAATVKTDHGQQTGSKLGKKYIRAVYCHPAYLIHMQSTSCEILGWMKHKLESRLPGEISITSDMQMIPPLWQKVKRN